MKCSDKKGGEKEDLFNEPSDSSLVIRNVSKLTDSCNEP